MKQEKGQICPITKIDLSSIGDLKPATCPPTSGLWSRLTWRTLNKVGTTNRKKARCKNTLWLRLRTPLKTVTQDKPAPPCCVTGDAGSSGLWEDRRLSRLPERSREWALEAGDNLMLQEWRGSWGGWRRFIGLLHKNPDDAEVRQGSSER